MAIQNVLGVAHKKLKLSFYDLENLQGKTSGNNFNDSNTEFIDF